MMDSHRGRPAKDPAERRVSISVSLPAPLVETTNKTASKLETSRSKLMERALRIGIKSILKSEMAKK